MVRVLCDLTVMELVYVTHGSDLHHLSPLVSWLLVIGAVCGLVNLVAAAVRWIERRFPWLRD